MATILTLRDGLTAIINTAGQLLKLVDQVGGGGGSSPTYHIYGF